MPKNAKDVRCRIGEVEYVSEIINDAEQFAVEIGVPRREMLFIFLDQCLGRCECASPKDRAALKKFFAQREKASQGDFSARMEAFWNPITDDEDALLDAPSKRPYWTKKIELAYHCPTRDLRFIFERGKLARVHHLRSPVFEEVRRLYFARIPPASVGAHCTCVPFIRHTLPRNESRDTSPPGEFKGVK